MATFRQATPDACRGCTRRSPPGTCTEWPHRKGHSQDWEWTHFGVVMTMSLHICMLGLRAPVSGVRNTDKHVRGDRDTCTTQLSTLEKDGDLGPHSHPVWAPQRHRTGDLKGIYASAMLWESSRGQRAYKEWGVFLAGDSIVQQRTTADPYSVIAYYTCTLSLQQIDSQKIPSSHTSLLKVMWLPSSRKSVRI